MTSGTFALWWLERHEARIRERERERMAERLELERRRMDPCVATTGVTFCAEEHDFEGCTL